MAPPFLKYLFVSQMKSFCCFIVYFVKYINISSHEIKHLTEYFVFTAEDDLNIIPTNMSKDCIAQVWYRILHIIGEFFYASLNFHYILVICEKNSGYSIDFPLKFYK